MQALYFTWFCSPVTFWKRIMEQHPRDSAISSTLNKCCYKAEKTLVQCSIAVAASILLATSFGQAYSMIYPRIFHTKHHFRQLFLQWLALLSRTRLQHRHDQQLLIKPKVASSISILMLGAFIIWFRFWCFDFDFEVASSIFDFDLESLVGEWGGRNDVVAGYGTGPAVDWTDRKSVV